MDKSSKIYFINRVILANETKFELIIDEDGKLSKVERLFDTYADAMEEGKRRCPPLPPIDG